MAVVGLAEEGKGTHHGKAAAAVVADGHREEGAADHMLMWQVVAGVAEHMMVAMAVGNKVFEDGGGWGYWRVQAGKRSFGAEGRKGNCKRWNSYYLEN